MKDGFGGEMDFGGEMAFGGEMTRQDWAVMAVWVGEGRRE